MGITLDGWEGKMAVVTGASSGIGAAIVKRLLSEGLVVVGLSRRTVLAKDVEGDDPNRKGKFVYFKCDVTDEKNVVEVFDKINCAVGPIHALINNAGVMFETDLIDGDAELWRKTFDTVVLSKCIVTREAIKSMNAHNMAGQIIHMNSVLGHVVYDIPKMNVYPATQYAITALTETLRLELIAKGSKIKVTSLSPGPVDTPMLGSSEAVKSSLHQLLRPEDVANAIVYILSTPPHVQVQELTIRPVGEPY
ncbi:farnesol dehydrogenase-like [Cylas formicarius]|uniref:farnesol dehydrogenase-like n=1 Tax=Cylas formicarius TaxID=197179 RepID=UPI002958B463|nr:farnesol dehydrogenase-like [Cylas formicarius]